MIQVKLSETAAVYYLSWDYVKQVFSSKFGKDIDLIPDCLLADYVKTWIIEERAQALSLSRTQSPVNVSVLRSSLKMDLSDTEDDEEEDTEYVKKEEKKVKDEDETWMSDTDTESVWSHEVNPPLGIS